MNIYLKIRRNPKILRILTGLEQKDLEYFLMKAQQKEDKNPQGRPVCEKLLAQMILFWMRLRHNPTLDFLGIVFYRHDKATVSRHLSKIRKYLQGLTLPQINQDFKLNENELLYVIRDVTEQRCIRSSDKEEQRKYYSGKKKAHTLKTEIIIDDQNIIHSISDTFPGTKHDKKIAETNPLPEEIESIPQKVDKGYIGLDKENENYEIEIPFKKSKLHPLTPEQKEYNKKLSSERIAVEHVFAQIKHFQCFKNVRKNLDIEQYQQDFNLVCGVINARKVKIVEVTV